MTMRTTREARAAESASPPVASSSGFEDGDAVAFVGSANLVRGSLNLPVHCGLLPYDELNVLIRDPGFTASLDASMDTLFGCARLVSPGEQLLLTSEWYSERRAQLEELWQ